MKAILTGARGFLGKYIYDELINTFETLTLSRTHSDINIDLSCEIPNFADCDLMVHCAGKAHMVPKTDAERQDFFNVNLTGTENLLKGLENCNVLPKSFVFISTVAVYGCEYGHMIDENHPLEAKEPYGESKIQAEQLVERWCSKNKVIYSILRLPLLVGIDPPGNLGAMIRGVKKGYYFNIAGGKAKKSMVFAKDVAKLIPIVANVGGIYNLTDGYHPSFAELSELISKQLGRSKPLDLSFSMASIMAKVGDLLGNKAPINSNKLKKITSDLTFDDSKARRGLNWRPNPILSEFNIK